MQQFQEQKESALNKLNLYISALWTIKRCLNYIQEVEELESLDTLLGEEPELRKLKKEIMDRMQEQKQICHDVMNSIEKMQDEKEKECLKLRYILGLTWDEIAEKMGYSRVHIHRIHNRALINFID